MLQHSIRLIAALFAFAFAGQLHAAPVAAYAGTACEPMFDGFHKAAVGRIITVLPFTIVRDKGRVSIKTENVRGDFNIAIDLPTENFNKVFGSGVAHIWSVMYIKADTPETFTNLLVAASPSDCGVVSNTTFDLAKVNPNFQFRYYLDLKYYNSAAAKHRQLSIQEFTSAAILNEKELLAAVREIVRQLSN